MKRILMSLVCVGLLVGCVGKRQHPVRIETNPAMQEQGVDKIAVFPFSSSLHSSDDPDDRAPAIMEQLFLEALDERDDYTFVSPRNVLYALDGKNMREDGERFMETWAKKGQIDQEFLATIRSTFTVEAIMLPVVDVWQKDEVDYRENNASSTTVGATITIIDVADGKVLFEAADEDFLESARSETTDRSVQTSGLGAVTSDSSGSLYAAPPHEEVAVKVARALARSIPIR